LADGIHIIDTADLGDDLAENAASEIGVRISGPGGVLKWLAELILNHLGAGERGREAGGGGDDQRVVNGVRDDGAIPSAGHVQQLTNGDRSELRVEGRAGEGRDIGQVGKGGLVELNFTLFNQFHDGDRGEGLAHAADAEQRIRLHGVCTGGIGVAEAARVNQGPIAGNGERGAGDGIFRQETLHDRIQASGPRGGLAGDGLST